MTQTTLYRFRWENIDKEDYLEQMKFRAQQLRRQAEILVKQAEAIEDERNKLASDLLEADDAE